MKAGAGFKHKHLREYVASSILVHCFDGCGYLSCAIDANASGEPHQARHFAYYAELRAAMSILAAEGVGVFDRVHVVVQRSGDCQQVPKKLGTHEFTWLALDHWAGLSRSVDLLEAVVRPGGYSLLAWLQEFGTVRQAGPIARQWLRTWGLDLRVFAHDREARNASSYRPTSLHPIAAIEATMRARFLVELWRLFEPAYGGSFQTLDNHLLRLSLEGTYQAITSLRPTASNADYASRVVAAVGRLGFSGDAADRWTAFLLRRSSPTTPLVITEASESLPQSDPRHHMQVMSRAALLLRVAAGAARVRLQDAGYGKDELRWWWKDICYSVGLWGTGGEPTGFVDLWGDVESALDGLVAWDTSVKSGAVDPSPFTYTRTCSESIRTLEGWERTALWGAGL